MQDHPRVEVHGSIHSLARPPPRQRKLFSGESWPHSPAFISLLTIRNRLRIMFSMNKLPIAKRAQILGMLTEGASLRATSRIADVSINTVTKLLVGLGTAARAYQDEHLRNLPCRRIQCDEIWAFCYAKQKNVPKDLQGQFGFGDVWTWTALCADTKIIPCWLVGKRDALCATEFMTDLAGRLANRIQLTTDGHRVYINAVEDAFGFQIDYAMLVKLYGAEPVGDARYSPPKCIGTRREAIQGDPNPDHISTSYVERANLTMRMSMRRFTRLTNGFSKKIENHAHAVAIHFMHYNFGRIHKTLRVTPAMEAGVADHVWSLEEIAGLTG
jgi:IS1 family transposase